MEESLKASSSPGKIPFGKVVLGYCHRPHVPHEFLECMLNLQAAKIGVDDLIHVRTFFVENGRNQVVREFLQKKDAEWLLFVDDDIYFTPDQVVQLYKLADKDKAPIIGGLYFGRLGKEHGYSNTILPVWLNVAHDGLFSSVDNLDSTKLQPVDVLGMGFTMIHRSVLEKMQAEFKENDDWVWFGRDIRSGKRIGEDATFCLRAKALGYPVYGTTNVILSHLKDHVYTLKMFMDQPGIFKAK